MIQVIETTETKRNKDELAHSGVVIENSAGLVNYGSWAKRRRSSKWTVRGIVLNMLIDFNNNKNNCYRNV